MDKRKRRLLCMLEGSGRKNRWISGAPPLSFKAKKAGTLENYRIYGNTVGGESVGDLVESGEHAGEYKVPVTVEGKNLLQNPVTSQTINGVTFTVNSDGSVTCNGTATAHASLRRDIDKIPVGIYKLSGCPKNGAYNTYRLDVRNSSDVVIMYNSKNVLDIGNGCLFDSTNAHHVEIRIENGYTCDNLTFYPMIRKADITDDTYEPYHAPVTVPIYLPEQIKKVGDEAEYIDYGEQKQHRIGADDLDVTLPALPTLPGTNVLSVGTAVQPSRVEVKGRIKAVGQETEPEPEQEEEEPEQEEPEVKEDDTDDR